MLVSVAFPLITDPGDIRIAQELVFSEQPSLLNIMQGIEVDVPLMEKDSEELPEVKPEIGMDSPGDIENELADESISS